MGDGSARLSEVRRRYAEALRQEHGVRSPAVIEAFATVAREDYLGPGPWLILDLATLGAFSRGYIQTPNDDPAHLYRDVLVAIDPSRILNNGQPSAHALWIEALDPRPRDHVVHIGCGTGYYTAILASVVGPSGRVTAIEYDEDLASRARQNLAAMTHVRVVHGDGCAYDTGPADAIYVNAGATHPLPLWLDRLQPAGRLLIPIVRWPTDPSEASASSWGVLMKIERENDGDCARIVSPVGIFPCLGAVDSEALAAGIDTTTTCRLRRDRHDRAPACWLHGDGYCFSRY